MHASVCLHAQGTGCLLSKISVKGAAREGVGSFPSHSVTPAMWQCWVWAEPFHFPKCNSTLGVGRGVGPCPHWTDRCPASLPGLPWP